jgi:hypothetical protein
MKQNYGSDIVRCRAQVGTAIQPSSPWVAGVPVRFIYCPSGQHTIRAGFRANDTIEISVVVDEETPAVLQSAFDDLVHGSQQEPYADQDHAGAQATLRFPPSTTKFSWGEIRGVEGVIVSGAEPTAWGAAAVNGRDFRSWSPEFTTDAAMDKAEFDEKRRHWTFPPFARGSASNPARLVGVNFVVGALTNRPAFKAMPFVKAKHAGPSNSQEVLAALAQRRDGLKFLLGRKVLATFEDLGR